MSQKKKLVDLCDGCTDNRDPLDSERKVYCLSVCKVVDRVVKHIDPGDKNRDKHCPQRSKAIG